MANSETIEKANEPDNDIYVQLEGTPARIELNQDGKLQIVLLDPIINPNNKPIVFINPEVKIQSVKLIIEFTPEGLNFYQSAPNNLNLARLEQIPETEDNMPIMNPTGPPFTNQ